MLVFTRALLMFILFGTPFWGGGRFRFGQELWFVAIGALGVLCAALFVFGVRPVRGLLSEKTRTVFIPRRFLSAMRKKLENSFRHPQEGQISNGVRKSGNRYFDVRAMLAKPEWWLFCFIGASVLSLFLSQAPWLGVTPWATLAAGALLFFAGKELFAGAWMQRVVQVSLVIATMALVFTGLWLYATGSVEFFTSLFFFPGPAAAWLLLGIPLALVFTLEQERISGKMLWGCIAVLLLSALFLTGTRGGYIIAACLAFPLTFVCARAVGWRKTLALAGIVPVALALSFALSAAKAAGSASGDGSVVSGAGTTLTQLGLSGGAVDSSTAQRFVFWGGALKIFAERPFTGWGPGTFASLWPRYQPDPLTFAKWPHSSVMEFLAEIGIAATVSFFLFCVFLFVRFWRQWLAGPPGDIRSAALGIGLFGLLLHSFGDVDFHYPALWGAWWIIAGMLSVNQERSPEFSAKRRGAPVFFAALFAFGGVALLIFSILQLRVLAIRASTAPFVASGDLLSAAAAAERAGALSGSPADFLQSGNWLLAQAERAPVSSHELAGRAVNAAARARLLDPLDAESFALEGEAYLVMKEYGSAAESFGQALARDPQNHPEYALGAVEALLALKRPQEAERTVDDMLQRYGDAVVQVLAAHAQRNYRLGGVVQRGQGAQLEALLGLMSAKAHLRLAAGAQEESEAWLRKTKELESLLAFEI